MVLECRKENDAFKNCMNEWFYNKEFVEECKEIYLKRRSEFRTTGIKTPVLKRGRKAPEEEPQS